MDKIIEIMETKRKWNLAFVLILALGWVMVACNDKDEDLTIPEDMKRFRPATLTAANGETQATITWPASLFTVAGQVTYTLQVATGAAFTETSLTQETTANQVVVTDSQLPIKVNLFARIKANGATSAQDSEWVVSSAFQITGEQIFLPILDPEILPTSVLLKWRPNAAPTRVVLVGGGNTTEVPITEADRAAASKTIENLASSTLYAVEIFQGNVSKGTTSFTTKEKSIYDFVLTPSDNFRSAIEGAANGAVIGLAPGVYNSLDAEGLFANLIIVGKTLDIRSTSLDPSDTKVNFKEITFSGNGSGVSFTGITFDAGPGLADYFLNFTGGATQFTNVIIDNCIVENVRVTFMRANRAGNNEHKIKDIIVKNSWIRNSADNNYHIFHLDKLEFSNLEVTNTTFSNNSSRAFIGWTTNITMPHVPKIRVNQVTINGLGSRNRNDILLDCNANNIDFEMTNSIIANTPYTGQTVGSRLIRASNAGAKVILTNTNMFNLTTGGGEPAPITIIDYVVQQNNTAIDLGWNVTTSSFTLPAGSPFRTASTTGGPIGDLRWAF